MGEIKSILKFFINLYVFQGLQKIDLRDGGSLWRCVGLIYCWSSFIWKAMHVFPESALNPLASGICGRKFKCNLRTHVKD